MLLLLLAFGCRQNPDWYRVEAGEWLPGGETTNIIMTGRNSFLLPSATLNAEEEQDFFSGNAFFNQGWVAAPASTDARDGLGPLFNARSCSACHFRDGRGAPPEDGEGPLVGVLLRLSVPSASGPQPHPVYGGQLQDQAILGVSVEGVPSIEWTEMPGAFDDGAPYSLLSPLYVINDLAHGPLGDDVMVSPRVAPAMPGLGLLEAIPDSVLIDQADANDVDGNGISGRVQWIGDRTGRFGWKGDAVDLPDQVAHAFAGDLGLTTDLILLDDCTSGQVSCTESVSGGDPEVRSNIFDLVTLYSRTIAPPARRMADDETVLRGKTLFNGSGCADCHTPSHTTGLSPIAALSDQLIWPYTDLLLHDMGEGLADGRPVGEASGQEWQTPALWSVGLINEVSGHTRFLHDGRARSLTEAILWHGGEAESAALTFRALDEEERSALVTFVEDL
ncbi:MAG: CxxC motif-containing protein (DUF1111 family) [Myxococcota bacterium]|jgi:CxxC motif-containing protein (DUF1111 family)